MLKKSLLLSLLSLFIFGLTAVDIAGQDFKSARAAYEKSTKRSSLHKRAQGIERFAQSGDPKVVKELAKRYKKPENENPPATESKKGKPQAEHVRYIVADVFGRILNKEEHVEELLKVSKSHKKTKNAWLWYNTWRVAIVNGQADKAIKEFEKNSNEFLKAAILEAFGRAQNPAILPALKEYLTGKKFPKKGVEREVMLRSTAMALLGSFKEMTTDVFKDTAYAMIDLMQSEETLLETKLAISRYLGEVYGVKKRFISGNFWRPLIAGGIRSTDGGGKGRDPDGGGTKVRFMGVEAAGKRVVFCIDFSDSMLTPLSKEEKENIKKPISGGGKKKEEKKGDGLPWDKIENRFDLAREYLKLAIQGLDKDVVFMVVWFGDKRGAFKATQGLVEASGDNKLKAIRELERVRPNKGAKSPTRPHGTLRGKTNIHGAMRLAFKAYGPRYDAEKKKFKSKPKPGFVDVDEHVDEDAFEFGADTVFLLSDGKPSFDDWPALDQRDPEDNAGDPESGARANNTPQLLYWGPYVWPNFLERDVQRMNMFRDAEIHCIAIGEADPALLQRISRHGLGTLKQMGAGKR